MPEATRCLHGRKTHRTCLQQVPRRELVQDDLQRVNVEPQHRAGPGRSLGNICLLHRHVYCYCQCHHLFCLSHSVHDLRLFISRL